MNTDTNPQLNQEADDQQLDAMVDVDQDQEVTQSIEAVGNPNQTLADFDDINIPASMTAARVLEQLMNDVNTLMVTVQHAQSLVATRNFELLSKHTRNNVFEQLTTESAAIFDGAKATVQSMRKIKRHRPIDFQVDHLLINATMPNRTA